ncbi:MAG TPA: hypothetical protein VGI41_05030, partial [Candidatus Udaeobacter sp.]
MNIQDQPIAMSPQIHTYTELRQQIHGDLRIQHLEWVQPNGESPICDSYEVRLMELLDTFTRADPTSLSLIFIAHLNREL